MESYNTKSKEELLTIIKDLEKQLSDVKTRQTVTQETDYRSQYCLPVFNALLDMLVLLDYNGMVVEVLSAPATNHIPEIPLHDMMNKTIEELLPPDASSRVRRTIEKAIATGETKTGEHQLVLYDKIHYFEHTISILSDTHLLCVCHDISKRMRVYKELKAMSHALSYAKEGIVATKMDGRIIFANDRFMNKFGLLGEAVNYNIRDLFDENTVLFWNNMIADVRREKTNMRYLIPKPEREDSSGTYEIFTNILRNEFNEEVLWCFVRDVTLRMQQQNEIARLNALLNAILNNIPVYLFVKDVNNDFRYQYWNKSFAEHSGIDMKDAMGKNDFELFPGRELNDRFHKEDLQVLKDGHLEYEEETITAKGEKRMMITIKTVINAEKENPYIVGIAWDTTDIRKAQEKLIEARVKAEEADKLKSSFLANMSHEIRTPLNAIVGFSKLAIEARDEEEKWGYIDIVDKNSKILLNLFNDILDLSAIESDSLSLSSRPVILHELCADQFELHRHTTQYGVKLIQDEADKELWTMADWDRLGQVVSNLLNNAIKFTQKGEIHYGFERKDEVVQFYVKDTGIGISANKIANIFQRFGKVNNFIQGTGLGLALSRMLVEKMGGRIWVRSKQGEGSTFYFTIPLNQKM